MATSRFSRRTLITSAGIGAGLAMTACTSPSSSGGGSDGGKPLKLLLLGPTQQLLSDLKEKYLPEFEKQAGVKVELQSSDWGSAFQKITTGAASNSLPDVFAIGGIWTAPLASKGVLLDLGPKLDKWDAKGEFFSGMLEDGVYEGKQYALPFQADVRVGMYRKDLLEEAGVSALPTTWDEFRAAAEKVKVKGKVKSPIYWNLDTSIGIQQSFAQLFLQAGGKYFDSQGKATFASDAGVKALTFMVDTFKDGLSDYNIVYSGNGPRPLVDGMAALTLNGVAVANNARDNKPEVVDKLAAGPGLKADAAGKSTSVAWINKFAIAASSKNPDKAWELVQYLTGGPSRDELAKLYGNLPVRKDVAKASWLTPLDKQVMESADNATSQPRNPVMMKLGPAVRDLLEPAIRGQASVAETLEKMDSTVDSLGS
ncbi:ABC transporter substrate-binding protein [Dermabacteraceae bacterium P7006]